MKINLWKLCVFQDTHCKEYHLLNMVHDKK